MFAEIERAGGATATALAVWLAAAAWDSEPCRASACTMDAEVIPQAGVPDHIHRRSERHRCSRVRSLFVLRADVRVLLLALS